MKIKYLFLLIFFTGFTLADSKKQKKDVFIAEVNQTWPYFLEMLNDTTIYDNNSRSGYILGILQKLNDTLNPRDTNLHSLIKLKGTKLIEGSIPENINVDKKISILMLMSSFGERVSIRRNIKLPDSKMARSTTVIRFISTGYIEYEKIYRLFVIALQSNDFQIQEKAYEILLKYSRRDYLKKYENEIRKGIAKFRKATCKGYHLRVNKEFCDQKKDYKDIKEILPGDELYMRLPLTAVEKKTMLKKDLKKYSRIMMDYVSSLREKEIMQRRKITELYYRALIGDINSEDSLITKFEEANTYKNKRKLANYLGIIGTPKCAKALIRELYTPIKYKNEKTGRDIYVRSFIIRNLGRIHPETAFLRMDISFIGRYGDKAYGGKDKIKEYLNKICVWAKKKYNIKPVDPEPEPVLGGGVYGTISK